MKNDEYPQRDSERVFKALVDGDLQKVMFTLLEVESYLFRHEILEELEKRDLQVDDLEKTLKLGFISSLLQQRMWASPCDDIGAINVTGIAKEHLQAFFLYQDKHKAEEIFAIINHGLHEKGWNEDFKLYRDEIVDEIRQRLYEINYEVPLTRKQEYDDALIERNKEKGLNS